MKEKIIFVTGAAGFIGKNSAKYFAENGWYVVGLGLGKWCREEFQEWGIKEWYPGLITKKLLAQVNKKPDVVLHCAGGGSVGFSMEHPKEDFAMTVESTENVLEFMRLHCSEARLIYPSSAAVYGQKEDAPIKETDSLEPVSSYGIHKKMTEELCEYYSKNFGIKISIVRFFSAYGPALKKQLLWDACNKIYHFKEEIIFSGTGKETRDFIHINDVVELLLFLSGSENKFEIMNGASGRRLTISEVLNTLAREYGGKTRIIFNDISRKGDPKFFWADITKIKSMGWKPEVAFESGVAEYVNNFKKTI
jgi:UDP-glucose 4-epimerase